MSRRIRVMRIIARMNVGGPAVEVASLMEHLDPERFDHRLYTGWCAADEADYLLTQAPDVPVHRVEGLGRAVRPTDDLLVVNRLRQAIGDFKPDIIHTHTAKAGVIGRSAAILAGTRAQLVHTFHGHLLHGYFSPAKTKAVITLERFLANRTARLVAVGNQVRKDLLAAGIGRPESFVVIPPGLDFTPDLDSAAARRALDLPPDALVVAFIGRLTGIKRADRFAEAIALTRLARPDVDLRVIVAGSGDTSDLLRSLIERDGLPIQMLGWRSDVPALMAASDALVLTSDNEGTPVSLIQAALSGLPVVATDVGSVSDIVIDGQTGLLCEPTAGSVATQLQRLIDSRQLRAELGANARQRAAGRFTSARLADDHARLYLDTLREAAGR